METTNPSSRGDKWRCILGALGQERPPVHPTSSYYHDMNVRSEDILTEPSAHFKGKTEIKPGGNRKRIGSTSNLRSVQVGPRIGHSWMFAKRLGEHQGVGSRTRHWDGIAQPHPPVCMEEARARTAWRGWHILGRQGPVECGCGAHKKRAQCKIREKLFVFLSFGQTQKSLEFWMMWLNWLANL